MSLYQKEYLEKIKYDNAMAWRNGSYVYEAVGVALGTMFGGSKRLEYPSEPHRIFPKTKEEIEQEKEDAKKKAIEFFNNMKTDFDSKNKAQDE